jgi:hypothetical protein
MISSTIRWHRWSVVFALLGTLAAEACSSDDDKRPGVTGGAGGGNDAGPDADPDSGLDSGPDPRPDARPDGDAEDAGDDASPDAGDDASPDAGDDASPDAGDDASADAGDDASPDASEDAGQDGNGHIVSVVEDFVSTANLDVAKSTASIDVTGVGRAFGAPPFILGDPGDGSEGAFSALDLAATVTLAPGEHRFTSFDARNVAITSSGDVVLRVTGDFALDATDFDAAGAITVYVGGQFRLSNDAYLQSVGPVVVHQRGTQTMTLAGEIIADTSTAGFPVEVFSRAPIDALGGIQSFDIAGARSGDVTVRSGGSIHLGDATHFAFVQTGDSNLEIGDVGLYSEGDVLLVNGLVNSNSTPTAGPGHDIRVRAAGGFDVADGAVFWTGPAGTIDITTGGALALAGGVFRVDASPSASGSIKVRAGSIALGSDSRFVLSSPTSLGPTLPGVIDLATTGDFLLEGSAYLTSSDSTCAKGGSIGIRAEGKITLGATTSVAAGASLAAAGCAASGGGDVDLLAGGAYVADPTAEVLPGAGVGAGTATALGGQAVSVGSIDPGLVTFATVESGSLAVEGAGALFGGATLTWAKTRNEQAVVEISLDGADTWVTLAAAAGKPLSAGWRYRVRMPTGQFDAAELDRIELTYAMP